MLMNEKMRVLWEQRNRRFKDDLPTKLEEIVNSQIIPMYGCLVLKDTVSPEWIPSQSDSVKNELPAWALKMFLDHVGFEFAVSKIHIEDYVTDNYLEYAFSFLQRLFGLFRTKYPALVLRGLIGIDEGDMDNDFYYSCTARYYIKRENERAIPQEPGKIDDFVSAVLVVDSDERIN